MHYLNARKIAQGEFMKLATFDLNLLLVFEAILREQSVTKAGSI
jgi:hypothetical protein